MIILTLVFAVVSGILFAACLGQLALMVYLWKRRKQALKALDALNNAVYSLSVDKAYLIAQQKPNLLWYDKADNTIH